ncbi:MAG: sigma-70 family RNA polymerase sigma factor [Lentisphaeraceae bacterium]|nr:sigma-70 family RNA polymerase sigma factor [Lentisphaeraceae bacterium]
MTNTNSPDEPKELSAEFVADIAGVQRQLHTYIYTLIGHRQDTEDILQEVNYVMWRKAHTFKAGTNFRSWAHTIALFQVKAFRKKMYRMNQRKWLETELIEMLAEESRQGKEFISSRFDALENCIQALPEDRKKLVAERYSPGGCVNDIASELGKAPKAVSETLRRIRHVLERCITDKLSEAKP